MRQTILLFGGSFDPPHYGHLNTAVTIQQVFHFDRFLFLPCKTPVLKGATLASSEQRITMLKLALEDFPEFEIDRREIDRNTPSYMVDTLQSVRQELGPEVSIVLLMGMDAFLQLPQWHCFEKLLNYSHLLVMKRPQIAEKKIPKALITLLENHETFDKRCLFNTAAGKIYRYDAGQFNISSTALRQQIKSLQNTKALIPARVLEYIKEQALYQ